MDHGLVDDRGRKIGGRVQLHPAGYGSAVNVSIMPTRDGVRFGASHGHKQYDTLEQAHHAAEAGLVRQRKAFARKFPGNLPK
jgi:hypothetical protein